MFFSVGADAVLPGIPKLPARMNDVSAAAVVRSADLAASDLPVGSNHVFGTTAMGADPRCCVCEIDDLYVCDTGIFPEAQRSIRC